jgi:hypothetical protein
MSRNHRTVGKCVVGLVSFSLAMPAWAYLDPSTGSMILSAIVGLFATLALAVKTYWYKLKSWFRKDAEKTPVPAEEQPPEQETPADR